MHILYQVSALVDLLYPTSMDEGCHAYNSDIILPAGLYYGSDVHERMFCAGE